MRDGNVSVMKNDFSNTLWLSKIKLWRQQEDCNSQYFVKWISVSNKNTDQTQFLNWKPIPKTVAKIFSITELFWEIMENSPQSTCWCLLVNEVPDSSQGTLLKKRLQHSCFLKGTSQRSSPNMVLPSWHSDVVTTSPQH